ncbi:hypothetical protein LPJ61_001632 [Coemansia biformis]|uniref:MYND-type domain-containing protein n=1 Tax=Coemansia biformis TaxID=1286918 RepID=A0A9W8CXX4_9FUNG|nr:hypothetical protein LPJ61_001632 [Coemansia biformis]
MPTTLGYAEPLDDDFGDELFPSKIGGRPRWLDPTRPLAVDRVLCDECAKPMVLLMQLYAPEDEPADAFHRMLYVFICRNGSCHRAPASRCMRVLRSQLPEVNAVYEEKTPSDGDDRDGDCDSDVVWALAERAKPAPLCAVCGLLGNKACSGCHKRHYCSRNHQVADWDAGHRAQCSDGTAAPGSGAAHKNRQPNILYPEHIIASEEEPQDGSSDDDDDDDDNDDDSGNDVRPEDMAVVPVGGERVEDSEVEVDPAFLAFQHRIRKNPDQVIRYARSPGTGEPAEPLFVGDAGRPESGIDIPDCEQCGAARQFEFQIMPQMINYLGVDSADPVSVDWGTLLVYSCPRSCAAAPGGAAHTAEVVWRQAFSSHGIGQKYVRAFHGDDTAFTRQFESLDV